MDPLDGYGYLALLRRVTSETVRTVGLRPQGAHPRLVLRPAGRRPASTARRPAHRVRVTPAHARQWFDEVDQGNDERVEAARRLADLVVHV